MNSSRRGGGRGRGSGPPRYVQQTSRTFEEASAKIQQSLQQHLERQDHGDLTDSDTGESSDDGDRDELLDRFLTGYGPVGENKEEAKQFLANAIHTIDCLICISSVKKNDPIWSCATCFVSFHISCVQRWAKDTIFQKKQLLEEDPDPTISQTNFTWSCPKCRAVYDQGNIPYRYTCYCGKEVDPAFDPWIAPHSCGEKCGRPLVPGCDHKCLVLCHPGPCPPCPQTVQNGCYCGNSRPTVRRCSSKTWCCGKKCGKLLVCGQHRCQDNCHPGECPPCARTSIQSCHCGKTKEHRECANPLWNCGTACGKMLSCGFHSCDIVCHEGDCPPCPLSETRYCPCGKSSYELPCTKATPVCGDTCGKTLACGSHSCAERCHRGPCLQCTQMTKKTCRCGSKSKEVLCSKVLTCDVKCKKLRDCRRHACNKRCCDGSCPACDSVCGKTLQCKNHKCESRCHQGPCYPCNLQVDLKCTCGKTSIIARCGREKMSRPPKCRQPCLSPTDCHHPARAPHSCHPPPCPPCRQICGDGLACGHSCPASCHDNVKVKVEDNVKPAGPWEKRGPTILIKKVPCPPCEFPVPITCLGAHETADYACHLAKVGPCGRKCGRQLACGNHSCKRDCHKVKNAADDVTAGSNCRKCERECEAERGDGCSHPCSRPCHPPPCPECTGNIKLKCHCGLATLYRRCGEFNRAGEKEREEMACCQDQCPKLLECGHRCTKICHLGNCSSVKDCKKKTKALCPCKRRKVEFRCGEAQKKEVPCDEVCKEAAQLALEEKLEEERRKKEEEIARNQKEIEMFERKGEGKRRRRNRREHLEEDSPSFLQKYKFYLIVASALSAVVVTYAFLLS